MKTLLWLLDIIARNVRRLRTIIEDLLTLARLEQEEESGQISLSRKAVRPVLENAAALCVNAAAERGISVELDCPHALKARLNAALLEQRRGQSLGQRGEIQPVRRHGHTQGRAGLRLRHSPRASCPPLRAFLPSGQGRSCKLGGTGLGLALAIVKHIVQAHHGTVSMDSAPGRGSVFTIRLPG